MFLLLPWDDKTKGLNLIRCFYLCFSFSLCEGFVPLEGFILTAKQGWKWSVTKQLSFINKDRLAPWSTI